jgi:hypothetical protein
MRFVIALLALAGVALLTSCSKKESGQAPAPAAGAPAAAQPGGAAHASVHLKDGSAIAGRITASSPTDMTVAGDDGIERTIPLTQIQSVEYGQAQAPQSAALPPPAAATTTTWQLPAGSRVSVRTNETIDSATATEGQSFDAQVTRDATDANGDVVIPRGSSARVVIKSASKGGRFRGASDLVLDLQSVVIGGKPYSIDTAAIAEKGKAGVGANKRTAEFGGGGAALGAIVGAIAGGGKGAAIGAGSGAGAGVLGEVLTKGSAIKVPAESVLTFSLDKPLYVTEAQ